MADTVSVLRLTREGATKVMDAVFAAAGKKAAKISVAIVDDGGNLILFARADNAGLTTQGVAMTKARAAAMTRFPSGKKSASGNERSDHHALAITLASGIDRFCTMEGGVPIKVKGQVVGGVAVSGAGDNDPEYAAAGAAVLDV
ncbi:MAG: heme-binding protein [candidate division NC10 bacterium]